jgi:signal transduction histidine kinase
VQAGVARYIDTGMPERASAALETIESTGRQALRDMRQLLGVLRAEGERAASSPAPALSDLDELVEGMRAAGTRVDLRVGGDVRLLPEGLELSAYRIVQEALTNVVKHAATDHARVLLRYQPEELAIEIVDDGAGARAGASGNGHGLVGMRERAALHGGSVEAGPLPVRGYRVAARLPIAAPLEAVPA